MRMTLISDPADPPALPFSFAVACLVEPEDHLGTADQDRTLDEVRLLHHQIDRFLLRSRQRLPPEYRASSAHELQESILVDVPLEERTAGRLAVDVVFLDLDVLLRQKPS